MSSSARDPIYTPTAEELRVATEWHNGMGSMFYAISSTGALSRGTIRAGRSDEEWRHDLAWQLAREIGSTIRAAYRQNVRADVVILLEWRDKVSALVEELELELEATEELEEEGNDDAGA